MTASGRTSGQRLQGAAGQLHAALGMKVP